jgi:hypothetical protein
MHEKRLWHLVLAKYATEASKQVSKHDWDGEMCISVQRYDILQYLHFSFYLKMFITSSQKAFQNYKNQ